MSNLPIYISLTTIFSRQDVLSKTLESIIEQTKLPDMIYLCLSEEPYLLDNGFKNRNISNSKLVNILEKNNNIIKIKWVENTGPYRKLLPLLKDKWDENCLIITIDDDTIYNKDLIKNIVNDYYIYNCVINYRGFTPLFNNLNEFDYDKRKETINNYLYNFPTGKGGILYNPQFFHKTGDLIFNRNIYLDTCKTNDDIWFYLIRILNNVKCFLDSKSWLKKDLLHPDMLYTKYNMNTNTIMLRNTLKTLQTLNLTTSSECEAYKQSQKSD
jgi:hypothetical protein